MATNNTTAPTRSPIKSTACKLPIKRKSSNSQSTPAPIPLSIINPNNPISPDYNNSNSSDNEKPESESHHDSPAPFKFHRIWSESDEIRFLQGLLGCASQNLVFPRDLNIFYDRFSDSMPQPYTRTQLSEKLRRLRKKFRVMSGRIEKGLDVNRLALHDRDLLHLCRRLWDPNHNSNSPFLSADSIAASAASNGSGGYKRRRVGPNLPEIAENEVKIEPCIEEDVKDLNMGDGDENHSVKSVIEGNSVGFNVAKCVLDAFNESVNEFKASMENGDGVDLSEMEKRWKEQSLAELDVYAGRLKMKLEESLGYICYIYSSSSFQFGARYAAL